jgi:hypothetical protein
MNSQNTQAVAHHVGLKAAIRASVLGAALLLPAGALAARTPNPVNETGHRLVRPNPVNETGHRVNFRMNPVNETRASY